LFLDGPRTTGQALSGPWEIVYLPFVRRKIDRLRRAFAEEITATGYAGRFHYAYPTKANAAEEVVRATLDAGAHVEISSDLDIAIVDLMLRSGVLLPEHWVIVNGFKLPGMRYTENMLRLKQPGANVIPILDDLAELPPLIESGLPFEVGIRQKSYGHHHTQAEMDAANSRFGMQVEDVFKAAELIASAPNLRLRIYHGMVGSQIVEEEDFVRWLTPPIEVYTRLRLDHPGLDVFNFGGGLPGPMTLDVDFDESRFAHGLLSTLQKICAGLNIPVPDVMGVVGRYTVTEHGAHLFKIIGAKENASRLPWYLIDGSIMTSFPDVWALGEHFIVLPLNHLDRPFRQVQLGGITCDSDDFFPPKNSPSPLYLPVETRDLYIGFFGIGAYQEMLGGVGGSKHCVIPEAQELIIDRDTAGSYRFRVVPGQTAQDVLGNLGYRLL
ncbi:MAG: arginine decarboxylase, partial [Chloroflexota bacterium]